MSIQAHFDYFFQAADGFPLTEGITSTEHSSSAIDSAQGLVLLALDPTGVFPDAALKTAEILADDMSVNFSPRSRDGAMREVESRLAMGFAESCQNAHEYLRSTALAKGYPEASVSLAVLQFYRDSVSLCIQGDYAAMHFDGKELKPVTDAGASGFLGSSSPGTPHIVHQHPEAGDQLLLMQKDHLQQIGISFLEVTLARFPDNLEMAVRQISTRGKHQGLSGKPAILLCRKKSEKKKGWFS